MIRARHLIRSVFIAAGIAAAAAPAYADASFATGGYARIVPHAVDSGVRSATTTATSVPSFATGGYARVVVDTAATPLAEPAPSALTAQPTFATGGYARHIASTEGGATAVLLAGDPWRGGVTGEYQGG